MSAVENAIRVLLEVASGRRNITADEADAHAEAVSEEENPAPAPEPIPEPPAAPEPAPEPEPVPEVPPALAEVPGASEPFGTEAAPGA